MLWVDKHRPHSLDKFVHANGDIAQHLKRLVADGDCPHLLFYGAWPPSVPTRQHQGLGGVF
jgi:replication factor C subunit 3/5